MKQCEKCGKEIDGTYGTGRFCSKGCSNSRIFSEESNQKRREANIKRYIENGSWGGILPTLTEEQRKEIGNKRREHCKKILMDKDFETLSYESRRKRVLMEQQYKCFECGLNQWKNKKLPLELEHKDGDHKNNSRNNLIALCPNCHSITPTWRGRNKIRDSKWLSSEEIYNLFKNGKNIRQILLLMGFAAKGDNYSRVRRILEKYEEHPL